jgi:hypothetical protein
MTQNLADQAPGLPNGDVSAAANHWVVGDRILEMRTPWCTVIGEHWQDHRGHNLDYWRIERADSLIILPIHRRKFLLPPPMYRPGVGAATLDFPGGRLPEGVIPAVAAAQILWRELAIPTEVVGGATATPMVQIYPLNPVAWNVNSSFSNQGLLGFWAVLDATLEIAAEQAYPTTLEGIQALTQHLTCLQCRALLLEWWFQVSIGAIAPGTIGG